MRHSVRRACRVAWIGLPCLVTFASLAACTGDRACADSSAAGAHMGANVELGIHVTNGAYGAECAYAVRIVPATGESYSAFCEVAGVDCFCTAPVLAAGSTDVSLLGRGGLIDKVLDQRTLDLQRDACGEFGERVTFERPRIEEFNVRNCEEANVKLKECNAPDRFPYCYNTNEPAAESSWSELTQCVAECQLSGTCAELNSDDCIGDSGELEPSPQLVCILTCFDAVDPSTACAPPG